MKLSRILLLFSLQLSAFSLFAQQPKPVQKDPVTNNVTESFDVPTGKTQTFEAGSTLDINGTLSGTPTGGTLNLSNITLTLPAATSALFQPVDGDLSSIAANITGGFLTRTAADTYAARTITGTAGQITVTNGDGVLGNPVLSLPSTITQATTFSAASGVSSGVKWLFGATEGNGLRTTDNYNLVWSAATVDVLGFGLSGGSGASRHSALYHPDTGDAGQVEFYGGRLSGSSGGYLVLQGINQGGALLGGDVVLGAGNNGSSSSQQIILQTRGLDRLTVASTGEVALSSTTASTSPTTGALTVAGGVGVAGAAWFGGNVTVSKSGPAFVLVNTGAGGSQWNVFVDGASGQLRLTENGGGDWLTINKTTGATTLAGDLSVNGGDITSTGALAIAAGGTNQSVSLTPSGTGTVNAVGDATVSGSLSATGLNKTHTFGNINSSTAKVLNLLGADASGIGVKWKRSSAEDAFYLGVLNGTDVVQASEQNFTFRTSVTADTLTGTDSLRLSATSVTVPLTAASTSTSTGALIVSGGLGVSGAINAGGAIGFVPVAANEPSMYMESSGGSPTLTSYKATGASTYYGSRIVTGDVTGGGVSGLLFQSAAPAAIGSHAWGSVGTLSEVGLTLPQTTASNSTTTGALTVAGGAGIAGRTSTGSLNVGTTNGTTADLVASAAAALDFGSIAAGASADLTITVTGASTGDSVEIGPPSAPTAGIVFTGFVSLADTVTVRAHNYTAGAIDPASATFRVTVTSF